MPGDVFSFEGDIGLIGCGRLGSALVEGWLAIPGFEASRLIISARNLLPSMRAAQKAGVRINTGPRAFGATRVLVLAVKPAGWREALASVLDELPDHAVIVSVMAGVGIDALQNQVGDRAVARLMPTTAVARRQGVAALFARDAAAARVATSLFSPLADVVPLVSETLMDAATGVAGSGPAFIQAFVQALAHAGEAEGLDRDTALRLARGALRSAASAIADGQSLEEAMTRVASKGGTTEAGLEAMAVTGAAEQAAVAAVTAAVVRARTLAGSG